MWPGASFLFSGLIREIGCPRAARPLSPFASPGNTNTKHGVEINKIPLTHPSAFPSPAEIVQIEKEIPQSVNIAIISSFVNCQLDNKRNQMIIMVAVYISPGVGPRAVSRVGCGMKKPS